MGEIPAGLMPSRKGYREDCGTSYFICSCGAIWKTRYLEVVDVAGSTPVKSTNNLADELRRPANQS